MPFMKQGQPWLYDDITGDMIGIKDPDGGERFFDAQSYTPDTLPDPASLPVGRVVNVGGNIVSSDGKKFIPIAPIQTKTPGVIRVASFGDSTANIGVVSPDGTGSFEFAGLSSWPASGTNTAISFTNQKIPLLGRLPSLKIVYSGGISGETTTQMLGRDALAYSATRRSINDCIASNPDVVFFRGGSVNDLMSVVTPENVEATISATFENHKAVIGRFLSAGLVVFDFGMFGYNNQSTYPASYPDLVRYAIKKLNGMFAAYADSVSRLFYTGPNSIQNQDGTIATGLSDGVHLNTFGGWYAGNDELTMLSCVFDAGRKISYIGNNLVANSTYWNVSSGSPVGFATAVSNATISNKRVELNENGVPTWRMEVAATSADGTATFYLPYDPSTAGGYGIVAGDTLGFELDFELYSASGIPEFGEGTCFARVDTTKSGAGRILLESKLLIPLKGALNANQHITLLPLKYTEASSAIAATGGSGYGFFIKLQMKTLEQFTVGISGVRIVKNPS